MANVISYETFKAWEAELEDLTVNKRKEISEKIKEAREQGDLSENAEYDAAKDEQRDNEARITQLEELLKDAEVYDDEEDTANADQDAIRLGSKVVVRDVEFKEDLEYKIVGATEASSLNNKLSNESPLGLALIGHKAGDTIKVDAPIGELKYKIISVEN